MPRPHDRQSLADDDALAAGGAGSAVFVLGLAGALAGVGVAAAGAATVELDAVAGAGDAEAFAGAARGGAGDGRRGAGAGAARSEGRDVGLRVGVFLLAGLVVGLVDGGGGELGGELLDGGAGEGAGADGLGGVGLLGHGALDLGRAQGATLGDIGLAAGAASGLLSGGGVDSGGGLGGRDVQDVELAAGGGLDDGVAGGVVGDVVAVDDIVVPVALALLQGLALEAEGALPATGLVGILGKRELAVVVVPGAEQVDGQKEERVRSAGMSWKLCWYSTETSRCVLITCFLLLDI